MLDHKEAFKDVVSVLTEFGIVYGASIKAGEILSNNPVTSGYIALAGIGAWSFSTVMPGIGFRDRMWKKLLLIDVIEKGYHHIKGTEYEEKIPDDAIITCCDLW